jgi:hypothetical protein
MKKLLLAGVAALLMASAAHAAYDDCAVVLETPDGFLALREEPTAKSKLILKLHRGDVLDVDVAKTMASGVYNERIIDWTWVIPFNIDSPGGYVYNDYIQKFKCAGNPYPPEQASPLDPLTSPELREYVKKQICEIYKDCK